MKTNKKEKIVKRKKNQIIKQDKCLHQIGVVPKQNRLCKQKKS